MRNPCRTSKPFVINGVESGFKSILETFRTSWAVWIARNQMAFWNRPSYWRTRTTGNGSVDKAVVSARELETNCLLRETKWMAQRDSYGWETRLKLIQGHRKRVSEMKKKSCHCWEAPKSVRLHSFFLASLKAANQETLIIRNRRIEGLWLNSVLTWKMWCYCEILTHDAFSLKRCWDSTQLLYFATHIIHPPSTTRTLENTISYIQMSAHHLRLRIYTRPGDSI